MAASTLMKRLQKRWSTSQCEEAVKAAAAAAAEAASEFNLSVNGGEQCPDLKLE